MNTLTYRSIFSRTFFSVCLVLIVFAVSTGLAAESFDKIKADLDSREWEVRMAAVERLNNLKDEKTIDLLMQVAENRAEYWPVKIKAIKLLGESSDPKAVHVLLTIFNEPFHNWECPAIKSYTALALGNFKGNTKVVDSLIAGINDRELFTREASIQSLGKIGNPAAVLPLVDALKNESPAVKLSAIKSLEMIGDPQAIPHLQRIAENDNDPVIKDQAKTALKNFSKK
jgi:HEAT repeat protein